MELEVLGITGFAAVVLTGLVAGVVELIKRLFNKEWQAALTIALAAVVGGLGALYLGTDFLAGVVYGLGASGLITILQNIGTK